MECRSTKPFPKNFKESLGGFQTEDTMILRKDRENWQNIFGGCELFSTVWKTDTAR